MSNASRQLIISLSPDMLCAATTRKGKVVQAERVELDPRKWLGLWEDGLMNLDQPLRQLISRFPSRKCSSATIIYNSPTLTQRVYKFDLNPSAAKAAGIAKIKDSVGFSDPVETCIFTKSGKGSEAITTLVYSEREEQLRSLYAWLNRCNVGVDALIPTNVAVMNTVAQIASDSDPETAVFYIGPDVTVMAYATESGLKLIRSAEIGYQKLVEGYIQALKPNVGCDSDDDDQSSFTQNAELINRAVELLFEHGIPVTHVKVDGIELRSTVLPMLAPVLQRFCIELKQTFRFGLNGLDMPKNLMICGPGATIPHIGKTISQHIDMHIKMDPTTEGFAPMSAFGRGSIEHAFVELNTHPNGLLPEIAHDAKTSRMLSRSLVAGGMVAALAMGAEYTMTTLEHQNISQLTISDAPRLNAVNDFREQLETANNMSSIISDVSKLVCQTVISVPQWHGLLANISEITSDSIRMQELRGDISADGPTVEINGLAVADSEKEAGKALNKFITDLDSIDGVTQVTLGATSRIRVGEDQWGRQFMMKVTLEQTPLVHQALVQVENDWKSGETP